MYPRYYLDTREEEEAHARFLLSAARYASGISSRVLKSHLNILSFETLRMKNWSRGRWSRKNETCQYCHTLWKNGDFSFKVLPVSKKQKRMKKICRNIEKNKALVKIEKKLAEARNIRNVLLVKCLVCTKEVRFKLRGTYTRMAAGGMKISVPVSSVKNMEKKMKKIEKLKMKKKAGKISNSHSGISVHHGSGFPSHGASKGNSNQMTPPSVGHHASGFPLQGGSKENSNQMKSPGVGHNISQNGDGDEIEITYESCSPEKMRKVDYIELDHGKPGKNRKKKKAKKTAGYGAGVLNTPSSVPYNTPGDATYNTPYSAQCATPYDMQYNTPYGIPYSTEYNTPYNNGTYAAPYNQSCNTSYDEVYSNYGGYGAVGYNPPGPGGNALNKMGKKKKKKKKKGAGKNQNSQNNDSNKDLFLNPFSDKAQEICDLPKMKLNRWKKLVSEEESRPTNSSSFKDFLDKLKRV